MGTDPPANVRLDLPSWMWGGAVEGYFQAARLQVVGQAPAVGDPQDYTVCALERANRDRPNLVSAEVLAGPGTTDRFALLDAAERSAGGTLPSPARRRSQVQAEMERLA